MNNEIVLPSDYVGIDNELKELISKYANVSKRSVDVNVHEIINDLYWLKIKLGTIHKNYKQLQEENKNLKWGITRLRDQNHCTICGRILDGYKPEEEEEEEMVDKNKMGKCKYCGKELFSECQERCEDCNDIWLAGNREGYEEHKNKLNEVVQALFNLSGFNIIIEKEKPGGIK